MSRRPAATPGVDGLLVLEKPRGLTSHDAVSAVRKLYGQRRAGHTGTLDPSAAGVLLVCLGKATRLVEYLVGHDKVYQAQITFGCQTDTYDADGTAVAEHDASALTESALAGLLPRFLGAFSQLPPPYSAKKVNGQRAHRLARAGLVPDLKPAQVRIDSIELQRFGRGRRPTAQVLVHCSAGTYIRSLAHDLGQASGLGAHLSGLERLAVRPFWRTESYSLSNLAEASPEERLLSLLPLLACVGDLPIVSLGDDHLVALSHGKLLEMAAPHDGPLALVNQAKMLVGVGLAGPSGIQPSKVLL